MHAKRIDYTNRRTHPVNVLPQTNGPVGSVTNANVSIVGLSPAPFVIGL
jgi:hypothetical protein